MIIIAEWKIIWLYMTLMVFYTGLDHMAEPVATILRRKEFDFGDAMAETILGLVEILIGAFTTLYVLNK